MFLVPKLRRACIFAKLTWIQCCRPWSAPPSSTPNPTLPYASSASAPSLISCWTSASSSASSYTSLASSSTSLQLSPLPSLRPCFGPTGAAVGTTCWRIQNLSPAHVRRFDRTESKTRQLEIRESESPAVMTPGLGWEGSRPFQSRCFVEFR